MANICFTFEVDGRAAYVAFTTAADAGLRLAKGFDIVENGRSLLTPSSVVSHRPSRRSEIGAFIKRAAQACLAGRIDWKEDVMDGYPIFLIDAVDPNFPDEDINTGLPMAGFPSSLAQDGRALRYFGIDVEDTDALYRGASTSGQRSAG